MASPTLADLVKGVAKGGIIIQYVKSREEGSEGTTVETPMESVSSS